MTTNSSVFKLPAASCAVSSEASSLGMRCLLHADDDMDLITALLQHILDDVSMHGKVSREEVLMAKWRDCASRRPMVWGDR